MTKLSSEIEQHLRSAKTLLQNKVESWRGREPFPGDPESKYRLLLADVNLELRDYELAPHPVPISPHLYHVLAVYRTLLVDAIAFWSLDEETRGSYAKVLAHLDATTDQCTIMGADLLPRATNHRPKSQCVEQGKCVIKVSLEETKSDTPFIKNGTWVFNDPDTYSQNRECLTCGQKWVTTFQDGVKNTQLLQPPTRSQ